MFKCLKDQQRLFSKGKQGAFVLKAVHLSQWLLRLCLNAIDFGIPGILYSNEKL